MFKPEEIAFARIEPFVDGVQEATIDGVELERDGLRVLVSKENEAQALKEVEHARKGPIRGSLITFKPGEAGALAIDAIHDLEPGHLYRWAIRMVESRPANVLVGRSVARGSHPAGEPRRSRDDPAFVEAMDVSRRQPFKGESIGVPELLDFYAYQMRYLLLWVSIERFATLRWGFHPPVERVRRFAAGEDAFGTALRAVVDPARHGDLVYRADRPADAPATLALDHPVDAALYYYQVRSNVTHRGKSSHDEKWLVERCLSELHEIFTRVLDETLGERSDGLGR